MTSLQKLSILVLALVLIGDRGANTQTLPPKLLLQGSSLPIATSPGIPV